MITKISTVQTWPSRVSDYQTKNNQWTITLLSHISLYTTVSFSSHLSITMKKNKLFKEEKIKVQNRY